MVQWKLQMTSALQSETADVESIQLRTLNFVRFQSILRSHKNENKFNGLKVEALKRPTIDQRCWGAYDWMTIGWVLSISIILEKHLSLSILSQKWWIWIVCALMNIVISRLWSRERPGLQLSLSALSAFQQPLQRPAQPGRTPHQPHFTIFFVSRQQENIKIFVHASGHL